MTYQKRFASFCAPYSKGTFLRLPEAWPIYAPPPSKFTKPYQSFQRVLLAIRTLVEPLKHLSIYFSTYNKGSLSPHIVRFPINRVIPRTSTRVILRTFHFASFLLFREDNCSPTPSHSLKTSTGLDWIRVQVRGARTPPPPWARLTEPFSGVQQRENSFWHTIPVPSATFL